MLRIDHLALEASAPEASARFLADMLGGLSVSRDGAEDEFFKVELNDTSFILYAQASSVTPQHVAFHVDREAFHEVLKRLEEANVPLGNDPEELGNGLWQDAQGAYARVYFLEPAGHFLEVIAS